MKLFNSLAYISISGNTNSPVVGTLSFDNVTESSVELTCTATDDIGVASFDIYVDAVFNSNVIGSEILNHQLTGLTPETNYDVFVVARDTDNNQSLASNIVNFNTEAQTLFFPAYEDSGAIAAGASVLSIDIPYMGTINDKDILLMPVIDAESETFSAPAGWETLSSYDRTVGSMSYAIFWKRADGTETGSVTVTGTSASGGAMSGIMHRISGAKESGSPFDGLFFNIPDNVNQSLTLDSSELTGNYRLATVLSLFEDNTSVNNLSTNFTERSAVFSSTGSDTAHFLDTQDVLNLETTSGVVEREGAGTIDYNVQVGFYIIPESTVADTEAPTAPTNLAASLITSSGGTLTWDAATDNIGVTGYDIHQDGLFITTVETLSYVVSGLVDDTSYAFTVYARDAKNNISTVSNTVNVTTTALDTTDPILSGTLTYANETHNSVLLSGITATDNIAVSGFNIYDNENLLTTVSGSALSNTEITGLLASTAYIITVAAIDTSGNESTTSNSVSFTTSAAPAVTGVSPRIYDFEVTSSNNRIYFKSSKVITASTVTGFFLGDGNRKTISGVVINTGQLTGHYFTTSSSFDYWDIYALRYEGGSNFTDGSNALHPFWLYEVENNITEPTSTGTAYWVRTTGSDSNDGLSHANAFLTITHALTFSPNILYIEAGDYGNQQVHVSYSGTSSNPVLIQGYKTYTSGTEPDALPDNYWNRVVNGNEVDVTELPTITGTNAIRDVQSTSSIYHGVRMNSYMILKNFQVRKYHLGIFTGSGTHKLLKNINVVDCGPRSGATAWGGIYDNSGSSDNYHKYVNINIADTRAQHLVTYGHVNYYDNVKGYSDLTTVSPDYMISIRNGSNSVCKNSLAERDGSRNGSHHGFGCRSNLTPTTHCAYNLFTDNISIGSVDGFEYRHSNVYENVVRNHHVYVTDNSDNEGDFTTEARRNGISVRDYAHDNKGENIYINNVEKAFHFFDTSEDGGSQPAPYNNYFRNVIIRNVEVAFSLSGRSQLAQPDNNVWENVVVDNIRTSPGITGSSNVKRLATGIGITWSDTNIWRNMTVSNSESGSSLGALNMTFENCNWFNQAWGLSGTNIINVDPLFTDRANDDYSLQSGSLLIDAGVSTDNKYGILGNERISGNVDIGAHQK